MSELYPFVSVVMPARNEAEFIERSLGAILAQDYPGDRLEVIVVDGMSDDGTREFLRKTTSADSRLSVIDNPRKVIPSAMNLGIRRARGSVILRVDGHSVIPPDYVSSCIEWLLKENVDGVGGAVRSEATTIVGRAIADGMSSPFGIGASGFRTANHDHVPREVDTLPFWAFKRDVFTRIGLFNESFERHEDYELNYRLRKSGGKLLLLPWLRVKYYVRSTFPQLWRQYWGYGLWKGRFLRTYPGSVRLKHLVPPAFVFSLTATALLLLIFPKAGFLCLSLLAIAYCGFLLLGTVCITRKGSFRRAPLIPLVLLSLHLAWGTGVWAGILLGRISQPPGRLTP